MDSSSAQRPTGRYILYGIIAVIVLLGMWVFSTYNSLITQQETMNTSWSQVETQYQRRFDLVPNLVNTVKGAAKFEQSTLLAVTQARTQWQNAGSNRDQQISAATQFDAAMRQFSITVEAYPQLTATKSFSDLMAQLEGTENRIATARRDFNNAVLSYNLTVKRFPGNIIAGMFGFAPQALFQGDAGSQTAPQVNFTQ